jgi:transcriptional regulator with PAS, ATPase and Fis domain
MIKDGHFREDLFYRLNVLHVTVAPLRDRTDDIPLLLDHFLRTFARHHDSMPPQLTPEALGVLIAYDWPGNVRELRNLVERLVVSGHQTIGPHELPLEVAVSTRNAMRGRHRPHTVVDDLMKQMTVDGVPFWHAVYPVFMSRDLTREDLREIVRRALEQSRGSYKLAAKLFNLHDDEYKRFLGFLRKHECHVAFQPYRRGSAPTATDGDECDEASVPYSRTVIAYGDFVEARRRAAGAV